jgi:hypothetical protein
VQVQQASLLSLGEHLFDIPANRENKNKTKAAIGAAATPVNKTAAPITNQQSNRHRIAPLDLAGR